MGIKIKSWWWEDLQQLPQLKISLHQFQIEVSLQIQNSSIKGKVQSLWGTPIQCDCKSIILPFHSNELEKRGYPKVTNRLNTFQGLRWHQYQNIQTANTVFGLEWEFMEARWKTEFWSKPNSHRTRRTHKHILKLFSSLWICTWDRYT